MKKMSRTQFLLLLNLAVLGFASILLVVFLRQGDLRSSTATTDHPLRSVSDFALLDQQGKFHKLSRYRRSRAVVLYVHGVGCPIVRNHLPTLRQLRDRYEPQGVTFLLLNCNPQDDRQALQQDAEERDIDIPILRDDAQLVMDMLKIERTGETFLIDPISQEVVYHGPVDDRLDYESQKMEANRHYLRDAIDAFLAGRRPADSELAVRGCAVSHMDTRVEGAPELTYVENVAPILEQRCVSCHRPDGDAPWALNEYDDAFGWRAMIREVVLARRMPPRQPDTHYLPLYRRHGISPDESRTLVRWIDSGAPRGEGIDPLLTRDRSVDGKFDIRNASINIPLPAQQIPATGEVAYRTNALRLELKEDAWVRAGGIQPSAPQVLHHAFCRTADVEGKSLNPEKTDKRGQSDRWRSTNITGYTPGASLFEFPPNVGIRIPKKCSLITLYHYTTTGTAVTDHPRLVLFLHKRKPLFEALTQVLERRDFRIPAYEQHYEVRDDYVFPEDVLLLAVTPHMHYRGASFQISAELENGFQRTLFSIPNYRMTWQTLYWLKHPVAIPKGTRIECSGVFDNSELNELNPDPSVDVIYGQQSTAEMFEGWLLYCNKTEENSKHFDELFNAHPLQASEGTVVEREAEPTVD